MHLHFRTVSIKKKKKNAEGYIFFLLSFVFLKRKISFYLTRLLPYGTACTMILTFTAILYTRIYLFPCIISVLLFFYYFFMPLSTVTLQIKYSFFSFFFLSRKDLQSVPPRHDKLMRFGCIIQPQGLTTSNTYRMNWMNAATF